MIIGVSLFSINGDKFIVLNIIKAFSSDFKRVITYANSVGKLRFSTIVDLTLQGTGSCMGDKERVVMETIYNLSTLLGVGDTNSFMDLVDKFISRYIESGLDMFLWELFRYKYLLDVLSIDNQTLTNEDVLDINRLVVEQEFNDILQNVKVGYTLSDIKNGKSGMNLF